MMSALVSSGGFRFSFPLIILGVVALTMGSVISVTQENWGVAANLPYVLLATSTLMALAFHQGRIAMVSLAMCFAYLVIQTRLQVPLYTGTALLELCLLALLLPPACFVSGLFKRDGANIKTLLYYLGIVALFFVWSWITITYVVETQVEQWTQGFLFIIPEISRLPVILVLYCLGLILTTGIFVLKYNRIFHVVVYSCILMASSTFVFFDVMFISSTMFSLSGLMIIMYILTASYELAFKDSLTDIPGRHALNLDTKHLGKKYAIAMIDVDHFKKFNDKYGHDTGDDVLKLVAKQLTLIGGGAKVYRYGGEEFTAVFKGKLADETEEYLDEIRENIANYDLYLRDPENRPKDDLTGQRNRGAVKAKPKSVNITISIGVADSLDERSVEKVIKTADMALYDAKKAGRNRVKVRTS